MTNSVVTNRDAEAAKSTQLVLIIEDEAILRNSMARGLGRLPGVEIAHAGNLNDARKIIRALKPRVIVTDLDLPDGSGTELIAELESKQSRSAIIVVSAYVDSHYHLLSTRPDVEIREKPLPLEQLRQLVRDKLGLELNEQRQPFSAVDYVQLACMGQRSVEIAMIDGNRVQGRVQICRGDLWSAHDEQGSGPDALRRLLFQCRGRIEVRSLAAQDVGERSLEDNWQWLLMEAARLSDEGTRQDELQAGEQAEGAAPAPAETAEESLLVVDGPRPGADEIAFAEGTLEGDGAETPPYVDLSHEDDSPFIEIVESSPLQQPQSQLRPSFDQLFEDGVEALLAKRYHDAYRAFFLADATAPGNRNVQGNLLRLRQMGYALDEEEPRT